MKPSYKVSLELVAALSALTAGILWIVSAKYGMTELPRVDASYDAGAPAVLTAVARLQSAATFNGYAAVAAAVSAFAQCAALLVSRLRLSATGD